MRCRIFQIHKKSADKQEEQQSQGVKILALRYLVWVILSNPPNTTLLNKLKVIFRLTGIDV